MGVLSFDNLKASACLVIKGNMIKHKKTHETLPIDQPDIDLDEYMDEEWDVTDIWQSLRRDEAAMEKYLKNKKK